MNTNPIIPQDTTDATDAPAGGLPELRTQDGSPLAAIPSTDAKTRLHALLTSQGMVVVVVLIVSAGSLFFMRRHGVGAKMDFKPVEIDYQHTSAFTPAEQTRILTQLERSTAPLDLSPDAVRSNPFFLETTAEEDPVAGPVTDNAAQRRQAEINAQLATLALNGVMGGPVPLARINGQTVRVGDVINDLFLVAKIHDRAVDLIVDDKTFTISMGDAPQDPRRGGLRANPTPPRR